MAGNPSRPRTKDQRNSHSAATEKGRLNADAMQDVLLSSDSNRTAIDGHAVAGAGQLLMSAIWLVHRVRSFSMRLSMLPSQRAPSAFVVSVQHPRRLTMAVNTGPPARRTEQSGNP
jgi:hypothetical protein